MVDIKNYIEEQIGDKTVTEHINDVTKKEKEAYNMACRLEKEKIFNKLKGKYVIKVCYFKSSDGDFSTVCYGEVKELKFYEFSNSDIRITFKDQPIDIVIFYDDLLEGRTELLIFDTEEEMLLYREVEGI